MSGAIMIVYDDGESLSRLARVILWVLAIGFFPALALIGWLTQ